MRRLIVILALLGLASGVASSAVTATVTLTYDGAGNFDVKVGVDPGAGYHGLAIVKVPLAGFDSLSNQIPYLDVEKEAGPPGPPGNEVATYGFHQIRSADDTSPVSASQDMVGGLGIVYGVGQTAGDMTFGGYYNPVDFAAKWDVRNAVYGVPVTVVTGTYSSTIPSYAQGESVRLVLFNSENGYGEANTDATELGVEEFDLEIVLVPEPATLGLLAIGGIGVLLRRRRRA